MGGGAEEVFHSARQLPVEQFHSARELPVGDVFQVVEFVELPDGSIRAEDKFGRWLTAAKADKHHTEGGARGNGRISIAAHVNIVRVLDK